jgi:hypothetical protein
VDVDVVADKSNDRRYFTVVPNIVDDSDLDPFAFRLYVHLKRVAGETGRCTQSTSTLATACKMSRPVVVDAKKTLVEKGLITIDVVAGEHPGRPYHEITIKDIWQENITSFAKPEKPTTDKGSVVDLCDDQSSRGLPLKVNVANFKGSVVERKKNPIRRTHEEEHDSARDSRAPTKADLFLIVKGFCDGLGIDPESIPRPTRNGYYPAAKGIWQAGYTPEQVKDCTEHLKAQPFWADKALHLAVVAKELPQWRPKPAKPNGHAPPNEGPPERCMRLFGYYGKGFPDELYQAVCDGKPDAECKALAKSIGYE